MVVRCRRQNFGGGLALAPLEKGGEARAWAVADECPAVALQVFLCYNNGDGGV